MLTRSLKEGSLGSLVMVYTEFLQGPPLKQGLALETHHIIDKPMMLLQHLSTSSFFVQNMNIPEIVFWPY